MTIYGEGLQHPLHADHPLQLRHDDRPYWCDGCGQIGFGVRYACSTTSCNFHLHKPCALREATITHPFYPDRVFVFLDTAADSSGRYCDACAIDIHGYNYHCFDHNLDLHPNCATLPSTINEWDLKLKLKPKLPSKCYKCREREYAGERRKSWGYVSSCGQCHLHVACVKEVLLENWEKEWLAKESCVRATGEEEKMAIVNRGPLQLEINARPRGWRKFAKWKKIVKIALTFIMAAIVGDPTALVIGLFSSLLTH